MMDIFDHTSKSIYPNIEISNILPKQQIATFLYRSFWRRNGVVNYVEACFKRLLA